MFIKLFPVYSAHQAYIIVYTLEVTRFISEGLSLIGSVMYGLLKVVYPWRKPSNCLYIIDSLWYT